ncbi:hypothetical protein K432DRAFT_411090 [Lepidopterella palustris CBS 459.81]|uniref:CFEM domain-containing protein n=1 Tax=Lepidopterella palustris CBS 459.81 TaxID=1314670 RepID=A0A8E2DWK0_9PEZI|nr:hypothetical protein K432DRAFT_411090 [Lepidopterella palustris CBS 459.81]
MKLGVETTCLIFFATVASAQTVQSILAEIPACAQQCAISAVESSPCANDQTVACVCVNIQAIIPELTVHNHSIDNYPIDNNAAANLAFDDLLGGFADWKFYCSYKREPDFDFNKTHDLDSRIYYDIQHHHAYCYGGIAVVAVFAWFCKWIIVQVIQ